MKIKLVLPRFITAFGLKPSPVIMLLPLFLLLAFNACTPALISLDPEPLIIDLNSTGTRATIEADSAVSLTEPGPDPAPPRSRPPMPTPLTLALCQVTFPGKDPGPEPKTLMSPFFPGIEKFPSPPTICR